MTAPQPMLSALHKITLNEESPDMLMNLVHELRQPLSAIETIAFYLEMRLPEEHSDLRHYILKLQQLVEVANAQLSSALTENAKIIATA